MTQDQKPEHPSQQDPGQGNEIDPRQKEPIGPGGDRGGIDKPGAPTSKNPGHTNPSHNTPGHTRQDQPGQQDKGTPGQGQTQSYPGIKGPATHDLEQDNAMDKQEAEQVKHSAEKKGGTDQNELHPRPELGLKSVVEESEYANEDSIPQEAEKQKATQFDRNRNPEGAPSTPLGPKDDAPVSLGNESQNDQ